jgi:hypothetical protein
VRTLMSGAAWVHYGQIYVLSGEDYPDLADCSGGQSNGLCGAAIGAALAQELVAVIGDGSGVLCDRMSPSAWAGRWLSRGRGRAIRRPPGGPRATGSAWQAASRRPALPRRPGSMRPSWPSGRGRWPGHLAVSACCGHCCGMRSVARTGR